MLSCEIGAAAARDVEDFAVFASQLGALGVGVRFHVRSVPDGLSRDAQFDLAPYLFDGELDASERVVLLGAHRLADERLSLLRRLAGASPRTCLAFGAFENHQALVGAKAKLSYVLGQDPHIFDHATTPSGDDASRQGWPIFGVPRRTDPDCVPNVLLVAPDLEGPAVAGLTALAVSGRFRTAVLTDGKSKQAWQGARGTHIPFFRFGEILPADLAERVEICVSFAPIRNNYRLRCLIANLAVSGAALIDASPGHEFARHSDAFIRGPIDLLGLAPFIASEIAPNLRSVARHARGSKLAQQSDATPVLEFLGASPRPRRSAAAQQGPAQVVFMPTNGVGLGHAQRSALIAAELDPARVAPVFAAFPSCLALIKSYGFDVMPLIGRSALHAQSHENDLANYIRLLALTEAEQVLVFDGGYVFDSVYRTIGANALKGVWIRRGLWRAGQDNSLALDREKAFQRVIVPGEAFEELNIAYSHGDHLRVVGPIVQRTELSRDRRRALRKRLALRFDRPFDRLVVSQLGGGVAADRGAQIQALCGMMERRPDTLHLVVAWPSTALQPAWSGWPNTRVVRTQHAGVIAAAADLCISAAGYNSVHEALYNATPTIFIPQTAPFMDDQRARARAARDRGLAGLVEPHELMALERHVCRFLDEGKAGEVRARIAAFDLPETGNAQAARLIEEFTDGNAIRDHDPVADSSVGTR